MPSVSPVALTPLRQGFPTAATEGEFATGSRPVAKLFFARQVQADQGLDKNCTKTGSAIIPESIDILYKKIMDKKRMTNTIFSFANVLKKINTSAHIVSPP